VEVTEPRITIVGCGPGSADHITPAARKAAQGADVLVGAERLLNAFGETEAERVVVRAEIPKVLSQIEQHLGAGRSVAVLVSGDPGLFSLAQPIIERFGIRNCRVIAGISSVQQAFARLGLSWHDARILSAHGTSPSVDLTSLRQTAKIAVLLGRRESLEWCLGLWDELGESYRAFLCQNLTLEDESVTELSREALETSAPASKAIIIFVRK